MAATMEDQKPWFLRYSYPVLFPTHEALTLPQVEFDAFVLNEIKSRHDAVDASEDVTIDEADTVDSTTLLTESTTAEMRRDLKDMEMDADEATEEDVSERPKVETKNTFMDLLHQYDERKSQQNNQSTLNMENKTFTTNGDITNVSTLNPLVDLFAELEDTVTGPRLQDLLRAAWEADALMTLKIIFNARSIHLGKSSRVTFYRCAGWLAQNHPATLVANLRWLARPVIEKKGKKDPKDEDLVVVDEVVDEEDPLRFDVKHGVAHGYWKDLLNILALAANGELTALSDPSKTLNPENPEYFIGRAKRKRVAKQSGRGGGGKSTKKFRGEASTKQQELRVLATKREEMGTKEGKETRRADLERLFNGDAVYRALHLTVARLFADQLTDDLLDLRSDNAKVKRNISLCGKWAPSHDRFHDKHTLIVSTIAELLHPRDSFDHVLDPTDTRETYLRYAREEYRKDISALRKHLDVVERKLSAKEIQAIKYERLPSKAMQNYAPLFIEKDFERFEKYLDKVADGKAQISGATLLPSLMVSRARKVAYTPELMKNLPPAAIVKAKVAEMEARVADGQWKALVQRIKDSGTLSNCIAIADVSGSMSWPAFKDGTTPMDTSIALSMIIAEVAEPPFQGSIITFDNVPQVIKVEGSEKTFTQKVQEVEKFPWGGNTNFTAVFEKLILPMAIKNKLTQDQMVKRIFVFSDMQFDAAEYGYLNNRFSSSLDRIKTKYNKAGYEVPELVFWNLAGGQHDNGGGKPVLAHEEGTSLVSGYSQGMLKVFLDNGSFEEEEDEEEDEEEMVEVAEDGEEVVKEKKKKKMDPLGTAKKAVGHKAYEMLRVVD